MSLGSTGRVHFVGIGGAGMSAIAKVLLERGSEVSGSDVKASRSLDALADLGASVHVGHDAALVADAGTIVVSSAIPAANAEVTAARAAGIPIMTRGEALAALLSAERAIIVAGTHGKTTTTSMIVAILTTAGIDPTYLVGGGLNDVGTNARSGDGGVAVAEADESDGSFLLLRPAVAVITNIELDHVDRWASIVELRDAFARFVGATGAGGIVVVPHGDPLSSDAEDRRIVTFGDGGQVFAEQVELTRGGSRFRLVSGEAAVAVELPVPGTHNIANAVAAAAACISVGVSTDAIARGLGSFAGVERRFDVQGVAAGVTVIDDYAHHPTEITATLEAARSGGWQRVVAVFQPHRYSRTAALWREFGASLGGADRIVVTDVYGAGEQPVPGVSGKLIAGAVADSRFGRPVAYIPHRQDLTRYLQRVVHDGDVVLTLGAGDITTVGPELLERLRSA